MGISKRMLAGTAITGGLYFVVGEWMYKTFLNQVNTPLLIGLYYLGLSLFVIVGTSLTGAFMYHAVNGYRDIVFRCILLCAAILAAGCLFEFLYEAVWREGPVQPDSYVFLMDNSGSMKDNDPENKRYDAIQSVLKKKESGFPFAVYIFADRSSLLRPMGPISQGLDFSAEKPDGGTGIRTVLSALYDEMDTGGIDLKKNGKVLLFTDGHATDMGLFGKWGLGKVLKKYSQAGVSISTVGLGNTDRNLMNLIAKKTGGVYISVDDADMLEGAVQTAMDSRSGRNLLDYRNYVRFDFLYTLIRFAAVLVIGLLLAAMKTYICEPFLDTRPVLLTSVTGSLLAASCVEFGMNRLGLAPWLMRLFMCVLLAEAALTEGFSSERGSARNYEQF